MAGASKKQINWHEKVLPRATRKGLEFFAKQPWLKQSAWYLAGGTALALQVGNRSSVDLDFFTPQKGFRLRVLLKHLQSINWQTTSLEEDTLYGEMLGAKVSFISYPFFIPKQAMVRYGNVRMLQPIDIAVMKMVAVSQRGRKRDFMDLFWCAKHLEPLEDTMRRLKTQYPTVAHDYYHILKSLTYFEDAENDPMPRLYFSANWREVKIFFKKEAVILAKKILQLG